MGYQKFEFSTPILAYSGTRCDKSYDFTGESILQETFLVREILKCFRIILIKQLPVHSIDLKIFGIMIIRQYSIHHIPRNHIFKTLSSHSTSNFWVAHHTYAFCRRKMIWNKFVILSVLSEKIAKKCFEHFYQSAVISRKGANHVSKL